MERTFDWKPRFDDRSNNFLIRNAAPELKKRNWSWKRTLWLDQGSEGACTGFGLSHNLGTTPRRRVNIDNEFARRRYQRAQQEDEWAGEDYEGSSVLGAQKAAQKDGLILGYSWAKTLDEILHGVGYVAPMEAGINWYAGMDHPSAEGIIRVTGSLRGGHALQIGATDIKRGLARLDNSWGKDWAQNGSVWLPFEDLGRLLSEDGEFALPRKAKL